MRVLVQRVSEASVTIDGERVSAIGTGLLVLAGFEAGDAPADLEYCARKLAQLRIFADDAGVMNLSLLDIGGEALIVSQFTLLAETKKGNRPSYIRAARPEEGNALYGQFLALMEQVLGKPVGRGRFGADMKVALVNDGPVTIWIDSRQR
jgi:D-tyrosyl-tRNA(Tyr) deacylase